MMGHNEPGQEGIIPQVGSLVFNKGKGNWDVCWYSVCIRQTGSGKSYTLMDRNEPGQEGIIPQVGSLCF